MAEYWKSTPSYWCKFCSIYVKDTPIEKKNHEASTKHQNNIQRNLRDLQKNKEREGREAQRAKDEVARLNGVVSGKRPEPRGIIGLEDKGKVKGSASSAAPAISAAAQRKLHAEQLAALGVHLPEDLKREVTGVGDWQVMSERVIEAPSQYVKSEIKDEEDEEKWDLKHEGLIRGVRKRRADDEEAEEAMRASDRKAWGSKFKAYPGKHAEEDSGDLDSLLSGVGKKAQESTDPDPRSPEIKTEEDADTGAVVEGAPVQIKTEPTEDAATEALPKVVFKKRKIKK